MFNLSLRKGNGIAIDLGNSNTVIAGKGMQYASHPSCIAWQHEHRVVKAVGTEASHMLGKAGGSFRVIRPLQAGVIVDFESASHMLKHMVRKLCPGLSLFEGFEDIVAGVPFDTTEVERRALRDVLEQFRAQRIHLVFEPIAAAIGMGMDIEKPEGKFLIDIGGGITEIVVISLSGIVSSRSVNVAGDTFDQDIQQYFKNNYSMSVGLRMVEQLKMQVGAAADTMQDTAKACRVVGKDLLTGLPASREVDYREVACMLNESVSRIEQAVLQALEECPPELAGDIYAGGIYLTGGGSLLKGLRQRLEDRIRLPVHHDPCALLSVAKGLTTVLQQIKSFKPVVFH